MVITCDYCNKEYETSISNYSRYNKHYCSNNCKFNANKQFKPDIEKFKKELWEYPITELAKKYNISVKTIHKFCNINKLTRPGRGYWQKKEVGLI